MVPEKLINEFVERIRSAAGTNLLAVILYGSVAAGDYVADHSDVNLLCVLGDTSFPAIAALAPAVEWWGKQKHRAPLLMSAEEMRRSADVFSIEFLDMRRHYRVLWGAGEDDPAAAAVAGDGGKRSGEVGAVAAVAAGFWNAVSSYADCAGRRGNEVEAGSGGCAGG